MKSDPPNRRPTGPMLAMLGCMLVIILTLVAVKLREMSTPTGPPEFTTQQLENFTFDQINGTIDQVPEEFRKLDGERTKIVGEMWAGQSAADELNDFDLSLKVRPGYHGPPLVQQFIKCHSPTPIPYYYNDRVRITGIFHVNIKRGPEGIESVYQLDVERVENLTTPSTAPSAPITFFNAPGSGAGPARPASWWYIVSIAVALPVLAASRYMRYRWRRERRRVTGRCLRCNYPLRGETEQCPECGSTFLEHFPPE